MTQLALFASHKGRRQRSFRMETSKTWNWLIVFSYDVSSLIPLLVAIFSIASRSDRPWRARREGGAAGALALLLPPQAPEVHFFG